MNSKTSKKQGHSPKRGLTGAIKSKTPMGILPASLRGFLAALLIGALLLLIASVMVYNTADPGRYVTPAALTVLYLAALMGGAVSALGNRSAALLCGALTAGFLLILLLAVSMIPYPSFASETGLASTVALRCASAIFALLGALMVSNKKRKKKSPRRK